MTQTAPPIVDVRPPTRPTQPVVQFVNSATVQAAAGLAVEQMKPVIEEMVKANSRNVLDELKKTYFGQETVKFFDSAIGKSVQTLLWTLAAYLLTIVGARLANIQLNAQLIALGVPGLLNWILYTAKVFVDTKVPNVPRTPVTGQAVSAS